MNRPLYWCKNEEGTYHKFLAQDDNAARLLISTLYDPNDLHTWKFGKVQELVNTETLDGI